MRISALIILFSMVFSFGAVAENLNFRWYMSLKKDKRENFMRQPVFVAFSGNGKKAYVVDAKGKLFSYTTDYGTPGAAFFAGTVLKKPISMARIAPSKISVVNREGKEIAIVNLKTKKIERIKLPFIPGVFYFKDSLFYILDRSSGDIVVLNAKFKEVKRYLHGERDGFIDFKIKGDKILALSPIKKEVVLFSLDSVKPEKVVKLDADRAKLLIPVSFDVDGEGFIFICDNVAGNVKVFYPEGGFKTVIFEKGQKKGELYYPRYIAFDKHDKLWIVEEGNGRVEVFDRERKNEKGN